MKFIGDISRRLLLASVGIIVAAVAVTHLLAVLRIIAAFDLSVAGLRVAVEPSSHIISAVGIPSLGILAGLGLIVLAVQGLLGRERYYQLNLHGAGVASGRGAISVAEQGLVHLLAHTADSMEGISGIEPRLSLGRKGWRVRCRVSIWRDTTIEEASRLRELLTAALERATSIQVDKIDLAFQHTPLRASGGRVR